MSEILKNLEASDQFIVPTYKTNSFISVDTKKDVTMENQHLICLSREVDRDKAR